MSDPWRRKVTLGDGRVTLYEGDCLEILPHLERVDAVVTDPPYGIGFKYGDHYKDQEHGYGLWIWRVIEAAECLANEGAFIAVFQAMPTCRFWTEWFPRQYRIFAAAKNFVQMRKQAMNHAFDPVLVWWTEGDRWTPDSPPVNRDWFVSDTASAVLNIGALAKKHPCPRQVDVMTYLARYARPNGTILDPFMGSGTTGVAAVELGRRFIGIEIEPRYFDIAVERISHALAQPRLFDDQPAPEQEALL